MTSIALSEKRSFLRLSLLRADLLRGASSVLHFYNAVLPVVSVKVNGYTAAGRGPPRHPPAERRNKRYHHCFLTQSWRSAKDEAFF